MEQDNKPKLELSHAKPFRQVPPKPELSYPEELKYLKVFDTTLLVTSYLILDGYDKKPENAITYKVIFHGFDYKEPVLKTRLTKKTNNGQVYDVTIYHFEMLYRHPMSVKLINPDGTSFLECTIPQTNECAIYKTDESNNQYSLNFKKEDVLMALIDKSVEVNLKLINNHVNEQSGKSLIERRSTLYNVIAKRNQNYDDLKQAFEFALSAYNQLTSNKESALISLEKAIALWEKALTEFDPDNKKCRINKNVTQVLHFNCAEAYIWLNQFEKADAHITKYMSLQPNRRELKLITSLKDLADDQRSRFKMKI